MLFAVKRTGVDASANAREINLTTFTLFLNSVSKPDHMYIHRYTLVCISLRREIWACVNLRYQHRLASVACASAKIRLISSCCAASRLFHTADGAPTWSGSNPASIQLAHVQIPVAQLRLHSDGA